MISSVEWSARRLKTLHVHRATKKAKIILRLDGFLISARKRIEQYQIYIKINVIKEIRAVTSLGLKEAKDLVEGAPKEVKSGANKKEAEEIKKKLEADGAKVELK